MGPYDRLLLGNTRRHFFQKCFVGLGQAALASLMGQSPAAAANRPDVSNPLGPKDPHFPPKIKSVIYLFMAGGPSQFELFDFKPELQRYSGKPIPQSFLEGKRFAFMERFQKEPPKVLGTRREFKRYGQAGGTCPSACPTRRRWWMIWRSSPPSRRRILTTPRRRSSSTRARRALGGPAWARG